MRSSYAIPALVLCLVPAGCSDGDPDGELSAAAEQDQPPFLLADGPDFVHRSRVSDDLYFPEIAGAGGALLDYDGDGDLDLYAVQGGSVAASSRGGGRQDGSSGDRLFRLDSVDGRPGWLDVTQEAGLDATGYGMGVTVGDIDNDGWPDLYLTNAGPNQLWRNNRDGTFSEVTAAAGVAGNRWSTSASFFDFDRDGWLDLYVANYVDFRLETHRECRSTSGALDYCRPLSYNPEPDRLYRNRGDGTFEDLSGASGISEIPGSGFGVTAADFNADGWPDIFVANDQMVNFLWINQGDGTFVEEAALAGCAVNMEGNEEASMGVVAADFNEDGALDLFMTHLDGETNTLYRGEGGGLFEDRTAGLGLGGPSLPSTGFGTVAIDFDNDGWQDIMVANGAVFTIEGLRREGDPFPFRQRDQLFRNVGGEAFVEVEPWRADAGLPMAGRGVAAGDLLRQGSPGLAVFNDEGPLLRFDNVGPRGDWIGIEALAGSGRPAIGATVEVELSDGSRRYRRVHRDGSYCSSHDPAVLVGLGDDSAGALRVQWPSGRTAVVVEPPSGRYLRMAEPSSPSR